MQIRTVYPTLAHRHAAEAILDYFAALPETQAVLVVNSTARGKATPDSCLDMAILLPSGLSKTRQAELEKSWLDFYQSAPVFAALTRAGRFAEVHLDLFDGCFSPLDELEGQPDPFEIEIGNRLVYMDPLLERGTTLAHLKSSWLPYYSDAMRRKRLKAVALALHGNLARVPWYVERELYFQAFDRLYHAMQLFLQGLFIRARIYPIAYNKWIREQLDELLGLPELYSQLVPIIQVQQIESRELIAKAQSLQTLCLRHAVLE